MLGKRLRMAGGAGVLQPLGRRSAAPPEGHGHPLPGSPPRTLTAGAEHTQAPSVRFVADLKRKQRERSAAVAGEHNVDRPPVTEFDLEHRIQTSFVDEPPFHPAAQQSSRAHPWTSGVRI